MGIILICSKMLNGQADSLSTGFDFNYHFRFRLEQDWDSRKSSGEMRNDRSRLRYLIRGGFKYQHNSWAKFALSIRTGLNGKQQDPQLTLGDGFEEFSTLPIGIEKAYMKGQFDDFGFAIGKINYPFVKKNELFWSDNVFPEGVAFSQIINTGLPLINTLELRAGHFIISASGRDFSGDSYFQGLQLYMHNRSKTFEFYPSLYIFRNTAFIPDGFDAFDMDYSILHLGSSLEIIPTHGLRVDLDLYMNLENYDALVLLDESLKDQKTGFNASLNYGHMKEAGEWAFKMTYNYQQRFAAVDYMSQNDWARWDYSEFGSLDGRLTNYQGIEAVIQYRLDSNMVLTCKYYYVDQLVALGDFKETGQRIRFDFDYKF